MNGKTASSWCGQRALDIGEVNEKGGDLPKTKYWVSRNRVVLGQASEGQLQSTFHERVSQLLQHRSFMVTKNGARGIRCYKILTDIERVLVKIHSRSNICS
jgi:hypothetical protein